MATTMHHTPTERGTGSPRHERGRPAAGLHLSFLRNDTLVWQQGPVIGSGRFGQVVLALRVPTWVYMLIRGLARLVLEAVGEYNSWMRPGDSIHRTEFVAVKQIHIQEECDQGNDTSSLSMQRMLSLDKIEREVDIVQSICHPNIVHFYGCERCGPVYNIFMEYIPAGSLSKYGHLDPATILKELGPFDEAAIRRIIRQLTDGVEYLHCLGMAHRDLKCANLLLTDDGVVKIADFGTAKRVGFVGAKSAGDSVDGEFDVYGPDEYAEAQETARSVREGIGSPYWMAPEIVRAECGADGWRKADVWGIGCVMVELATAKPPWDNHSNPFTAMFHIASQDAIPPIPAGLSTVAHDFLLSCFIKDPDNRSSTSELLAHEFLAGDVSKIVSDPQRIISEEVGLVPAQVTQLRDAASSDSPRSQQSEHLPVSVQTPHFGNSVSGVNIESYAPLSSRHHVSEEGESHLDVPPSSPIPGLEATELQHDTDDVGSEDEVDSYSSDEAGNVIPGEDTSSPMVSEPLFQLDQALGRIRALADYHAADANELSLRQNEIMTVFDVNEYGWWRGRREQDEVNSLLGWFPCTYAEWVPSEVFHTVRQRAPSGADVELPDLLELLELRRGDQVQIQRCEWRQETLWGFGLVKDGSQGWFRFECLLSPKTVDAS